MSHFPRLVTRADHCLASESSKQWKVEDGVWLVHWMRYQVFVPLVLLQLLNLFWYHLMCKILIKLVNFLMHIDHISKFLQGRSDLDGR